jgi:hypothetical protein
MSTRINNERELAQRYCDDIVLAAGTFKPNAPGRSDLSGLKAMTERQLLKGRGAYFTERMIIAVTPIDVVAIALGAATVFHPRRLTWKRSELRAARVPAHGETFRPDETGLCLYRASGRPRLEVARLTDDPGAWDVIERLAPESAVR